MSDSNEVIILREQPMNEETLIQFISEQINKYKNHAETIGNPETVTLTEMNKCLAEFSIIDSALLSLQAIARIKARKHRENFENWFSEKYVLIRNRENREDLAAQKWLGQKEIERIIRIEFSFEFKGFKDLMDYWEMKEDFIGRMLKSWSNHQFILNTISNNLQSQVMLHNTRLSRELE